MRRQPLHRDLRAVRQLPLQPNQTRSVNMADYLSSHLSSTIEPGMKRRHEAAFAEQVLVGEIARRGRQLGEVVQRELLSILECTYFCPYGLVFFVL